MRGLFIVLLGSLFFQGCVKTFNDNTHVIMKDGTKRERACSFVRKTIERADSESFEYIDYRNNYTVEEYRRIQEIDRQCIKELRLQQKDYSDYQYLKNKMESFKIRAKKVLNNAFNTK